MATRRTTTTRTHTRRTHRVRNFFGRLATVLLAVIGLLAVVLVVGLIAYWAADIVARGAHHGWFGAGSNPGVSVTSTATPAPTPTSRVIRRTIIVRQPAPAPQKGLTADDVVKIIRAVKETEQPCCSTNVAPPPTPPVQYVVPAEPPVQYIAPPPIQQKPAKVKKAPCQKKHWWGGGCKIR